MEAFTLISMIIGGTISVIEAVKQAEAEDLELSLLIEEAQAGLSTAEASQNTAKGWMINYGGEESTNQWIADPDSEVDPTGGLVGDVDRRKTEEFGIQQKAAGEISIEGEKTLGMQSVVFAESGFKTDVGLAARIKAQTASDVAKDIQQTIDDYNSAVSDINIDLSSYLAYWQQYQSDYLTASANVQQYTNIIDQITAYMNGDDETSETATTGAGTDKGESGVTAPTTGEADPVGKPGSV
jgi:hypothetical protein